MLGLDQLARANPGRVALKLLQAMIRTSTVAAPALLALAACSSTETIAPVGKNDTITFTMQSTVPPSGETHQCQYVRAPSSGDAFVVAGTHHYTPGSHHVLLFRTDLTDVPAGQDRPSDCYEGATPGFMSHVRGLVYGAQTPTGKFEYPDGVGLPMTSGEVMMMQTHYLNASSQTLDAEAEITLTLSDGSDITAHAGILFYYDLFIDVPPNAMGARAATRCLVPNDVTLLWASSHYHKRGVGYSAFVDPSSGPLSTEAFYTSSDWDHPSPLTTSMKIPSGSRIRFECVYDNPSTSEYFQGQSAEHDEMCMFIGTYYPLMEPSADFCIDGRDMMGTGTVPCGATLSCLGACPSSGSTSGVKSDVDPCVQKCIVSSCPAASAKLIALEGCVDASCATECATSSSDACKTCAGQKCLQPALACESDTCQ